MSSRLDINQVLANRFEIAILDSAERHQIYPHPQLLLELICDPQELHAHWTAERHEQIAIAALVLIVPGVATEQGELGDGIAFGQDRLKTPQLLQQLFLRSHDGNLR
jgi:hypothetical protein